jgi:uncharacterized DUF497 family protein
MRAKMIRFEWEPRKAAKNIRKHQISFKEAQSVFRDRLAIIFDDEEHSDEELREIIIGYSNKNRLLLVWFTELDDSIRIIGSRKATPMERKDYESHRTF